MILKSPPPCLIKKSTKPILNKPKTSLAAMQIFNSQSFIPCLYILLFFSFNFLLLPSLSAQVKIKEKVEIKPTSNNKLKKLASTEVLTYTPCGPFIQSGVDGNPWQVVWLGSQYPLDLWQNEYNYQGYSYNFNYLKYGANKIEILEGADKCELRESFKCDSISGECPDPVSIIKGSLIDDASYLDISGEGDFMVIQGIPSRLFAGYVRYWIRFTKEGNVTIAYSNPLDGNTKIYHTKIVKPDFYIEYAGLDELPHGEEENDFNVSERPIQCQGVWDFWNGGGLPEDVKFNIEILHGSDYAKLILQTFDGNSYSRDTSVSFSNLEDTYGGLFLAALGKEPEDTAIVKLRYSTTDLTIQPIEQEIKIVKNPYYPIRVNIEPEELMVGDTAHINIERRVETFPYSEPWNYTYEPFDADQLFDISIEKGKTLGAIFSTAENDTSDEFSQVTDGFYFIAKDTITTDSINISIRVKTVIYNFDPPAASTNVVKNKIAKINSAAIISFPTSSEEIFGIGKAKIANQEIEIMLGETKYFGVKKKEGVEEYKIEEIVTVYGEKPVFTDDSTEDWKWIKNENVWGTDPIKKLGTKSGVYWEKKWFDKSDNNNKDFPEKGMIRLVGRFWEIGKEDSFKVELKSPQNTEIEIKTVLPDTLLTEGESTSYSKSRDVFDKVINIDSLCNSYGGLFGIPPHMLKGQMFQESAKKNFSGSVGWGFAPSYRYEPYSNFVNELVNEIVDENKNPFIVTSNPDAMGKTGAASVPTKTEHQHLEHGDYFHYFESPPKTMWDIIEEKSRLVDINNTYTTYGFQYKGDGADTLKKGQIKSGVYSIIGNTFNDFLLGKITNKKTKGRKGDGYLNAIRNKYKVKSTSPLTVDQHTEANDSARLATIKFLKNVYQPVGSKSKGLDNITAQTRLGSSYGLFQTLYVVMLDEHKYLSGNNNNPEKLNFVDTSMVYSIKNLKKLFKSHNGFSIDATNSKWESTFKGNDSNKKGPNFPKPDAGFEEALKVMFYMWNSGYTKDKINAAYHSDILNNSEKFLPRKN